MDVVFGVPKGNVIGPILFAIYTADMLDVFENRLVNYADDSTLFSICRKPADRDTVTLALNRDLERISMRFNKWMMKLNPLKIKTLIVSRSRTAVLSQSNLILNATVLPVSNSLVILGACTSRFDAYF